MTKTGWCLHPHGQLYEFSRLFWTVWVLFRVIAMLFGWHYKRKYKCHDLLLYYILNTLGQTKKWIVSHTHPHLFQKSSIPFFLLLSKIKINKKPISSFITSLSVTMPFHSDVVVHCGLAIIFGCLHPIFRAPTVPASVFLLLNKNKNLPCRICFYFRMAWETIQYFFWP